MFCVALVATEALDRLACRALDEPAARCRGRSCSCELDEHARCLLPGAGERPECQTECGLEVAERCYQFNPSCVLALVGTPTVAECAGPWGN